MENLLNLSKEQSSNLLNLRKESLTKLCLDKPVLNNTQARVAVVLDYSLSMKKLYKDGNVQAIIERILPLAMQFDDNGEMELWIFENGYTRLPNINLNNYYDYVKREILSKGYSMGGTNYYPVMNDITNKYMVEEPSPIADYIIFITDGDNFDNQETEKIMIENSNYPIFWQFVGIGKSSFSFLEELDNMDGRYVDNANFFSLNDFLSVADNEIYSRLLKEFPLWLEDTKVKDMINNKYQGRTTHNSNKNEKKGLFSKLFG